MSDFKTTMQVSKSTLELLKQVKIKYKYRSNDELLEDTMTYFYEYNISPRDGAKPITQHFKNLHDTFVSFFRDYEKKRFIPFTEIQSKVNLKLLEFLENQNQNNIINNNNSNVELKENNNLYDEKIILELKEIFNIIHQKKKQIIEKDTMLWAIDTKDYFALFDLFEKL